VLLVTLKLPFRLADLYLNLKLIADDAEPRAFVKQVKAGFIALPKPLVRLLGLWFTYTTNFGRYVQMANPLFRKCAW